MKHAVRLVGVAILLLIVAIVGLLLWPVEQLYKKCTGKNLWPDIE